MKSNKEWPVLWTLFLLVLETIKVDALYSGKRVAVDGVYGIDSLGYRGRDASRVRREKSHLSGNDYSDEWEDIVSEELSEEVADNQSLSKGTDKGRGRGVGQGAVNIFSLEDRHEQLIVHWAGKGSDVVICLGKNRKNGLSGSGGHKNASSSLYFSYDYGSTFVEKAYLTLDGGHVAAISALFFSPALNSHYLLVDTTNNYVLSTRDFGITITPVKVAFTPHELRLHPTNANLVIAADAEKEDRKKLWVSTDFGMTWDRIEGLVKQYSWGEPGVDEETALFAQRWDPKGATSLISSVDYFKTQPKEWLNRVEDFEMEGKYIFATRRVKLLGAHKPNVTILQLFASYQRNPLQKSIFETERANEIVDYHIVDASEDQVMASMSYKNGTTDLYVSDLNATHFSLSLSNLVYLSPELDSLSWKTDHPLADIHKVAGLRGVYIASKWKHRSTDLKKSLDDMVSVISFDGGNRWDLLKPPQLDSQVNAVSCHPQDNCSLHLSQKFNQLYPHMKSPLILSKSSAVGILIASGIVGTSLKGKPQMFMSTNGGVDWRPVLNGNYIYNVGDSGGIIVAAEHFSKSGETNELKYSIDDGMTWQILRFMASGEKMRVFGLMTEPGEKSATFTLFGSRATSSKHEWVLVKLNMSSFFERPCNRPADYESWSLERPHSGCFMGRNDSYERRKLGAKCFNGHSYLRSVTVETCPCQRVDYECDFGFIEHQHEKGKCISDPNQADSAPIYCEQGKTFNRSRGYHKKAGNACQVATDTLYEPQSVLCPTSASPGESAPKGEDRRISVVVERKSITIPVVYMLLVVLLVATLTIFVLRHRRLQRSFLSFVNSHYNSRSGSASFSTNDGFTTNDGLEDEDGPVIRGFSDDEPLVLA